MMSHDTENVIYSLSEMMARGDRSCLVTLYHSDGSSPRPVGSQMAVSETGEGIGYLTGGCAEAAIIEEARTAITQRKNRSVRFGAGSQYIDITLPCGAGIDVFFDVGVTTSVIEDLMQEFAQRTVVALETDLGTGEHGVRVAAQTRGRPPQDHTIRRWYPPPRRLHVIGKGPIVPALARLGAEAAFEVSVFSPEHATLDRISCERVRTHHIQKPSDYSERNSDENTAVALVFHEHEWEPPILGRLLRVPCFYLGALGSRRTHQDRLVLLRNSDLSEMELHDRIHGPIGLDIGARAPHEIALAILAEIIKVFRSRAFTEFEAGPIERDHG